MWLSDIIGVVTVAGIRVLFKFCTVAARVVLYQCIRTSLLGSQVIGCLS